MITLSLAPWQFWFYLVLVCLGGWLVGLFVLGFGCGLIAAVGRRLRAVSRPIPQSEISDLRSHIPSGGRP